MTARQLQCTVHAVTVARATAADIAPAATLMRSVFAADITSTFSAYQAERVFAESLSARQPLVWVARAGDDVVGVCECKVLDALDGARLWHLSGLCVSPNARRQGAGSALVSSVQRDALAARRPLFLHVEAVNVPARELYVRAGFELLAEPLPPELYILRSRSARSVDPTAPEEVLYADPPPPAHMPHL
ncbi:acyl-CoA N-acyltransferase [Pavlovales sp. CCMP2436]|nr:acyl-CoA N-acyltransferase [Pavlovales sp. CCMP2436]